MKISIFRIGLMLAVIGAVTMIVILDWNQKAVLSTILEREETRNLNLEMRDGGIGYYKITIPDFGGQTVFAQIEDSAGNVISDKKIQTKMSVNYFDFPSGGKYTLKITNVSEKPASLQVEFGNTGVSALRIPAGILGIGITLILFYVFKRLRNYSMAQPDENIS